MLLLVRLHRLNAIVFSSRTQERHRFVEHCPLLSHPGELKKSIFNSFKYIHNKEHSQLCCCFHISMYLHFSGCDASIRSINSSALIRLSLLLLCYCCWCLLILAAWVFRNSRLFDGAPHRKAGSIGLVRRRRRRNRKEKAAAAATTTTTTTKTTTSEEEEQLLVDGCWFCLMLFVVFCSRM